MARKAAAIDNGRLFSSTFDLVEDRGDFRAWSSCRFASFTSQIQLRTLVIHFFGTPERLVAVEVQ